MSCNYPINIRSKAKFRLVKMKQMFFTCMNDGSWITTIAMLFGALCLTSPLVSAQFGDYPDLPGDYCRIRPGNRDRCCDGRIDSCSVPILGTLCYCDQFCNRTGNPDCCPDYPKVCLGISPPPPLTLGCQFRGMNIQHKGEIKDNCNTCTCSYGTMKCTQYVCMVDEILLQKLNSNNQRLGWTAANYSQFWGKKLDDGLMKLTGTIQPDPQSFRMLPIKLRYDSSQLPRQFDLRGRWPNVGKIRDQGWCAASWAFSTIGVAEDRLTIASDGTEVVDFSTQNLLSCNRRGQRACAGGHVERAWGYLRKIGVVTEECYPYVSGQSGHSPKCSIKRQTTLQTAECRGKQFPKGRIERYTTEPSYRISSRPEDVMYEIMTNGPVQALMNVHPDFFLYNDGVYSQSGMDSGESSSHSVRIIGWGVEASYYGPPIKYWLVTNSWGRAWGESGTFKIRRGTNEAGIETFILTVRTHLAHKARSIAKYRGRRLFTRRNRPSSKSYSG